MAKQKISMHAKNFEHKADGSEIPVKVKLGDEWVDVAPGIYDAKNKLVHLEVDTDTPEGAEFFVALTERNLVRTV